MNRNRLWALCAIAVFFLAAATTPRFDALTIAANPTIPSCPVSNCPPAGQAGFGGAFGGPTLSSASIYGQTTNDEHPQFLVNLGLYIGTGGNTGGKAQNVTGYLGAMQGPNAGPGWTLNSDIVRGACPGGPNSLYGQPGSGVPYGQPGCSAAPGSLGNVSTIGYELDLANYDADSATNGAFIVGQYINTLSAYTSGAGVSFGNSAGSGSRPSWHHGIEFSPNTIADATIYDLSGSPFGYVTGGTHALATFQDGSSGGVNAINLIGNKTGADISINTLSPAGLVNIGSHTLGTIGDTGNSPVSISVSGQHSADTFSDNSTTPSALNLGGTYNQAAITTIGATTPSALTAREGQSICFSGTDACFKHANGKLTYSQGGLAMLSIADVSGNAVFRGSVMQNGTP